MLAERRDLTVATYSSTRGTGAKLIVSVLTGSGFGAGCFASVLLHPELNKTSNTSNSTDETTKNRFNYIPPQSASPITDAQKSLEGSGVICGSHSGDKTF
jgi:hypothetical protein